MDKNTKWIGLLLTAGVVLSACASFDWGDIVQAKTPIGIRQSEGLPPKMSLNDAQAEYRAWFEDVQREGERWQEEIVSASEVVGLFQQLTLSAVDSFGPAVQGIPVAGPLLYTALAGGVGFLARSSGKRKGEEEGEKIAKEKERSFNAANRELIEELRAEKRALEATLASKA